MEWSFQFVLNSVLLGVGLAMDAFSVSLANGLSDPRMRFGRMSGIAGLFAFFQALMPMIGWICVHTIVQYFQWFEKLIPWIALLLLGWIGGKMLLCGLRPKCDEESCGCCRVSFGALIMQGIATSIDALSVGFTIAEYGLVMALVCAALIAFVTFFICLGGLKLGKTFGTKLANKADILGGVILIFIGLEIFITGIL